MLITFSILEFPSLKGKCITNNDNLMLEASKSINSGQKEQRPYLLTGLVWYKETKDLKFRIQSNAFHALMLLNRFGLVIN